MFKLHLETFYEAHKTEKAKNLLENYPPGKGIENYVTKIDKLWEKEGNKILKAISKITGLKWKEKEIKVYLIGFGQPYSDPLTMKLYDNKNDFIDVLTHELIHQIQSQNMKTYRKWFKILKRDYNKEPSLTRKHIFLQSVHKKIYLELFNKTRLNRDMKRSFRKEYVRAWEIIEKEGYDSIIKKFREVTK